MPGRTCPRKISRASSVGGWRQKNSVASTIPPGRHTRTNSLAARWRSTNIDRFGDHPVEPTVRESQPEDVSLLDLDVALKAGASNIAPGSLEHERRDIDRRDRDPEPTRHLNGGSCDSAADIERLLPSLQGSQAEELLRRATAARMDHALADDRQERVRVQRLDVEFWTGQRRCHVIDLPLSCRPLEGLPPSTPATRLQAVWHESRPVAAHGPPYERTHSTGRGSTPRPLCRGAVRGVFGGAPPAGSRSRAAGGRPQTPPRAGRRARSGLHPASAGGAARLE